MALSLFLSGLLRDTEVDLEYARRVLAGNVGDENYGQSTMNLSAMYAERRGGDACIPKAYELQWVPLRRGVDEARPRTNDIKTTILSTGMP